MTSRQMEPSSGTSLFSSHGLWSDSIPLLVENSPIEEDTSRPRSLASSMTHSLEIAGLKWYQIFQTVTLICEPQLGKWPKLEKRLRKTSGWRKFPIQVLGSWEVNDNFLFAYDLIMHWRYLRLWNIEVVEDPLPPGVANDKAPELCFLFILKLLKQDTHSLFIQSNQNDTKSNSLYESQEREKRLILTYTLHWFYLFHWSCWLKQECRCAFLPGRVIELSTHSQKLNLAPCHVQHFKQGAGLLVVVEVADQPYPISYGIIQGWLKCCSAAATLRAEQGSCEPSKGFVSKFWEH